MKKDENKFSKLNILVIGRTGVGKSTLINSMFGSNLTQVGIGVPVTQTIRKIEKDGVPLAIYDTPGLELSDRNGSEDMMVQITELLRKGDWNKKLNEKIHCIWYCVSASAFRVDAEEKAFIQKLAERSRKCSVPIVLVLTQGFSKKRTGEIIADLRREQLPVCKMIPVLAQDFQVDEGFPIIKAYGLDELDAATQDVLPTFVREKFIEVKKGKEMGQNEKLPKLNIMVVGKTGVGKSTLLNSLFGENLAITGNGKPITQKIRKFEPEGFPISIYDTPGMELDGEHSAESLLNEVTKLIQDKMKSNDIEQAIHCILYCINTTSSRFEESESDFLQKLTVNTSQCNTPVILVLTQSFSKKKAEEMLNEIRKMTLPVRRVVPVLAQDYEISEDFPTIKAFGLDKLVEAMSDVLPEAVRDTFVAMQIVNLDAKHASAQKTVTAAALAAAATGAAPIPFSDAALLVPAQVAMLVRITAIYRIPIQKAALTTIATAAVGTVGTTILGKTIVSNALKFIPGVGTVAGGAISATTAAALTTALGNTYIGLMTKIARGEMKTTDLSTKEGQEAFKREFKAQMKAGKR